MELPFVVEKYSAGTKNHVDMSEPAGLTRTVFGTKLEMSRFIEAIEAVKAPGTELDGEEGDRFSCNESAPCVTVIVKVYFRENRKKKVEMNRIEQERRKKKKQKQNQPQKKWQMSAC